MSIFKTIETEKYFKYEIAGHPDAQLLFTTRRGGVSGGKYDSLNMGYSTRDEKNNIYRNRQIVMDDFGLSIDRMVSSDQVHGVKLVNVPDHKTDCGECDGLFTATRGTVLCMYFADCAPIFFHDGKKGVIGLVHAGWRGTCNSIAAASVDFMIKNYGCAPSDITAMIGPSISKCCFEVGDDTAEEFIQKIDSGTLSNKIREAGSGKFFIDLKAINRAILLNSGLKEENISVHDACTSCMKTTFYSYRRDAGDTGRMAGLAFLN